MARTDSEPPPILDSACVLEYVVLDDSVQFSGRTLLFVEGKELGPTPCLAICQNLEDAAILLFHCDRDWRVLGVAGYKSVDEAKSSAERIYSGITKGWTKTRFTEEEVSKYLEEISGNEFCVFCGKRPDQVEALIEKNKKHICDGCVMEFYQMLHAS